MSDPQTTALVHAPLPPPGGLMRISEDFKLALEPRTFEEASNLAAMAFAIRMCGVKSPEDALVRIMTGRALGLTWTVALKTVFVIDGKPGLEAKVKIALAQARPECEYLDPVESTPEQCIYVGKRRGRPEFRFKFTIAEARAAGLLDRGDDPKKNNWNRFPAYMLRARAQSGIVDILFPEAALGLPSREELDDELEGEVLPAGTEGIRVEIPAPVPQAQVRDFGAEAEAIRQRILGALGDQAQLKIIRTALTTWCKEAGEPHASDMRGFYTEHVKAPKAEAAA